MKQDDIIDISTKYAEKYSKPPYFTVGYSVDYDEYLEMSEDLKTDLQKQCEDIINFILDDYEIVKKNKKEKQ